jgi:hypothetical protein
VNGDAVVFGWCFTGAAAIALALSLTMARRTLLGRATARWLLAICLLGGSVQLANWYTSTNWADLLWIIAPVVLAVAAAESRFRAGCKRTS